MNRTIRRLSVGRMYFPGLCIVAITLTWATALALGRVGADQNPTKSVDEPRKISPAEHGIGRRVPDLELTDIHGTKLNLGGFKQNRGLVIAFTSTTCPVSRRYLPALSRLEKRFGEQGIKFLFVDPISSDTLTDIEATLRGNGLSAPIVHDTKGEVVTALSAESTTEVFVLDSASTLVYRGAVDDQYGLSHSLSEPRSTYLADALEALLAGQPLQIAATSAPGCALRVQPTDHPSSSVSYHERASRILQDKCQGCHRAGGSAPFSLETRADATSHSAMIRQVVENGTMPPWFAAPPAAGADSPWDNDRSLCASDKKDLAAWATQPSVIGDSSHAPLPRKFRDGWQIGKPDVVLQIPEPVAVNAEGAMPYYMVAVQTNFDEDKWVRALEIQPTAKRVVHHVLVYVLPHAELNEDPVVLERRMAEVINGFFAVYVPGNGSMSYPDGFAKRLPAGATLLFQIHYTPSGAVETDQTRLGLVFAGKPPKHEVFVAGIAGLGLRIPPGASNHPQTASMRIPKEVQLLGFLAHMHARGRAFRFELVRQDGTRQTVLDIPKYDDNWQLYYRLLQPMRAPFNSRITITGWFDNSADNLRNPDPAAVVHWGPQVTDEMLQGYVEYFVP